MADADRDVIGFLSVLIGAIMEDCSSDAISTLPEQPDSVIQRFERLTQAGNDIVSLAKAAEVLVRRSGQSSLSA